MRVGPASAEAQDPPAAGPAGVVSRTADGKTFVRAVHITTEHRVDGRLDEETYRTIPPIGDFLQSLPKEGAPASERTDAWVFFD